jgi:hypothetical protein
MSKDKAPSARSIVDEILGRGMTREIWTANYDKVLPVSVQDFDLFAVLPAVFYMFRFGQRRGKGRFLETFGGEGMSARERRRAATIERIAGTLVGNGAVRGFGGDVGQAILGDLLLCFCLENAKRKLGRNEQVQRVAPAHFMASWVDLPDAVAHLRRVPEMIVAMLADQDGSHVHQNDEGERSWFKVGRGHEKNVLLQAFMQGVIREGELGSRTSDRFAETESVGIDQLLMIRLAQQLGAAPDKLRGKEGERISNQRPISRKASRQFSEDIRHFVRGYADAIPRHAFVELLESCVAVGMTSILTSVSEMLFGWSENGSLSIESNQAPTSLLVDCSNGVDRSLRILAEQSMEEFRRRLERLPVILMALRFLDQGARYDPTIKKKAIETTPYATDWINMLGEILFRRCDEAQPILYEMDRKTQLLAEALDEDYAEAAAILRTEATQDNPIWRLAEALTFLQGRKNAQNNITSLLDSCLLLDRPNGLAVKRFVTRTTVLPGTKARSEARCVTLSDSVLDYLVHVQVLRPGVKLNSRPLAFSQFVDVLRERYGFFIDRAPAGMTVSNELLQANRGALERRLRDLGLLVGVNDAESMKHVCPRFKGNENDNNHVD